MTTKRRKDPPAKMVKGLMNRPAGSTIWYGSFYDRDGRTRGRKTYVRLKAATEPVAREEYNALLDRWALGDFNPFKKTPKRNNAPRKGEVYVLRVQGFNFFKVGYTQADFSRRVSKIQADCPFELEVFRRYKVKHPTAFERCVHQALADYHLRGEWFQIGEEKLRERLMEVIKETGNIVSVHPNGAVYSHED